MLSSLEMWMKHLIDKAVVRSISNMQRPCAYVGNEKALTRTIYGHKMYVNTKDLSLAPHILLDGFWENWVTNIFMREVSEGMVVLDIGANIGYYSLLAAGAVGPRGMVYCFEANPDVHEILFQNLEINGFLSRAQTVNKAVFSEATQLEFNVRDKHQGSSSIFFDQKQIEIDQDNVKKICVPAISLDAYFPPGFRVDVIKVDAEGAEPEIIKGSARLLNENSDIKIIMEWAPALLDRPGSPLHDFYECLQSYGFQAFRIAHDSSLVKESFEELSRVQHCDILLRRRV